MEALVALGLASNVLQFVDFGAKLTTTLKELGNGLNTEANLDCLALSKDLTSISRELVQSTRASACNGSTLSAEDTALVQIADDCSQLAGKLITRLEAVGLQPNANVNAAKKLKTALKSLWGKGAIEDLDKRLASYREELHLRVLLPIRQQVKDLPTKVELDALEARLRTALDPKPAVSDLTTSLEAGFRALRTAHADGLSQTRSHHNDTIQVVRAAEERIVNAIQTQRAEDIATFSAVVSQSGVLRAESLQQVATDREFQRNILQLFEPVWRDHANLILERVGKEVRGAVRKELESVQPFLREQLDQLKDLMKRTDLSTSGSDERQAEARMKATDHIRAEETARSHSGFYDTVAPRNSAAQCDLPHDSQSRAEDDRGPVVVPLGSSMWRKVTRIGTFTLKVESFRSFRGTWRKTFKAEITFVPSAWICSTGISIDYEHKIDARGYPTFNPTLRPFAILPSDHPIFNCTFTKSIEEFRQMLDSGEINPYDRDEEGWTLLHYLVLRWNRRNYDMCEALLLLGADVSIQNDVGATAVDVLLECRTPYITVQEDMKRLARSLPLADYNPNGIGAPNPNPIVAEAVHVVNELWRYSTPTCVNGLPKPCLQSSDSQCMTCDASNIVLLQKQLEGLCGAYVGWIKFAKHELGLNGVEISAVKYLVCSCFVHESASNKSPEAVKFVTLEMIKAILASGVKPDARDEEGRSFLHVVRIAAQCFSVLSHDKAWFVQCLVQLISFGVDIFERDQDDCSIWLLFYAGGLSDEWEGALEAVGIDLDLFFEEEFRRDRKPPASASGHDCGPDENFIDRVQAVSRRRPFQQEN